MTDEELAVAQHEAGHLVAGLLLGIPVTRAAIEYGPYGLAGGATRTPELFDGIDREHARKVAVMLLCGWLMEPRELPGYPPDPESRQLDERWLATLVKFLKLDEGAYFGLRAEAARLTCEDQFVTTFEATLGLFERMPVIDEVGIRMAQRIGGAR